MFGRRYCMASIAVLSSGYLSTGTRMAEETHSLIDLHVLLFATGMATAAIKSERNIRYMRAVLKDIVLFKQDFLLNQ
jgi:hypothetical protein